MSEINHVLIMGAGTMGTAIAQAITCKGIPVTLVDQNEELLDRARGLVQAGLKTMVDGELYTDADVASVEANITYVTADKLNEVGGEADLVVESVFENHDVKKDAFAKLDAACRPDCIFCSNTSGSNVFDFVTVSHPERFLICHWFNPAYLMKLVEVVRGPETSDAVVDTVTAFARKVGKNPCVINQYIPGFIVNRIANAICREAGYMIENGWTTAEDIEGAIRATSGIRYAFEGPLALNDVVGWDIILPVCGDVYSSLCNDTDCAPYAERMVAENRLGVKAGKGSFDYSDTTPAEFFAKRSQRIIKMFKAVEHLDDD